MLPLLPRDAEPEDEPPDDELNAGNGYKPLMNIEHLLARLDKIMGTHIPVSRQKTFSFTLYEEEPEQANHTIDIIASCVNILLQHPELGNIYCNISLFYTY